MLQLDFCLWPLGTPRLLLVGHFFCLGIILYYCISMMMINVFRSVVVSLAFLYNFWVIIYRTAFDEITSSTVIIWWSSSAIFDCHWQLLWSDSAFPLKVSSRLSERLNICDGHPHSFPDRYVESKIVDAAYRAGEVCDVEINLNENELIWPKE